MSVPGSALSLALLVAVHTAFVVPMNASSAKATMNVMST
jgi:hypothetical protein